jgi:hypothetical protein
VEQLEEMEATMESDEAAAALLSLRTEEVRCYNPTVEKRRGRDLFPTAITAQGSPLRDPAELSVTNGRKRPTNERKPLARKVKRNRKHKPRHVALLGLEMLGKERQEQERKAQERQEQERQEQEKLELLRKEEETFRKGRHYFFATLQGKAPKTVDSAVRVAARIIMLQTIYL